MQRWRRNTKHAQKILNKISIPIKITLNSFIDMKKTRYDSYFHGALPRGCRLCVTGEKSVLFVTGLCSQNCYYCSLSDNKKNKDKIIINEWETKKDSDVISEITLCSSNGAGITGGDPLLVIDRTIRLIKLLKKRFGKKFHLHLYTPLKLVNKRRLSRLYYAGLDEIRFHPDVDNERYWDNLSFAKEFNWDVGVEIPALPHKVKETKMLIDFISDKIDFLNINELELSDNNFQNFEGLGFSPKDETSYAIKESLKAAMDMAKHAKKKCIKNIHVCTAKLKDRHQLRNRINRRAKNAKKDYDIVTSDGMLIRGAIYFSKHNILENDYNKIISWLKKDYGVPKKLLGKDKERKRILTRIDVVKTLGKELKNKNLKPAIAEEYPTHDCFPIEINYL